jgi:hypothetical protein
MNGYYESLRILKECLLLDNDINTVTTGDASEFDINNKNIYNLAHIVCTGASFNPNTIDISFSIELASIRDINKDIVTDKFIGNDNEQDNMNTLLYVARRLYNKVQHEFNDLGYFGLVDNWSLTPFLTAKENYVDGWQIDFTVSIPDNTMCANEF